VRTTRLLKAAAASAALVLLATGCSSSSNSATESAAPAFAGPVGDGEGAVNILAWPGYVVQDPDNGVDWVTEFETSTGCKVNLKEFGTSDAASGDATLRLIAGDTVAPVNTSLVPNYADIFPDLKDKSWNTVDGVNYGIPHGRGANVLAYRTDAVTEAPTSWKDTFDPASPYAGKVTAYDSPIYIADAALYLMTTQPDLGITDPYSLDQAQFDAAIKVLEAQKPIISEYWSDYLKAISALESGTTSLGTSWQVIVNSVAKAPVESVKPNEGATGWSDTWMVAKDAKNINCSYKWLDWIVSPETNAAVAEYFGEAPANAKSCEVTSDKSFCDTYHAADTEYWKNVYYWNTPSAKCLDGRTDVQCVPYAKWTEAWSALRA
jgi:putative spermidine/putrescine transport system substrate-binding protein